MHSDRVILHCDMNSYFVSVELLKHPELKDLPVAVAGNPKNRHGIILAKNEIAKKYGIKTGETIWAAKNKCKDLELLSPHYDEYIKYHKLFNDIFYRYSDRIEKFSVDESWIDVTESRKLFGTGKEIADKIRNEVREELGITLSAGVSFNKVFAKMGSEYKKPDATTVISRDNYKEVLWPLPVSEFFMVGKITAKLLNSYGIYTIKDLAAAEPQILKAELGVKIYELIDSANGKSNDEVKYYKDNEDPMSIGHGKTFKEDLVTSTQVKKEVWSLSEVVAKRLRSHNLFAAGVKVVIKDSDFKSYSRQKKLRLPTDVTRHIAEEAFSLIKASWDFSKKLRAMSITGIDLRPDCKDIGSQYSIFSQGEQEGIKEREVDKVMDEIKQKFGDQSIGYGVKTQGEIDKRSLK